MEEVIAFDLGCEPSPSVPAETLIQDGWETYLLFFAIGKSAEDLGIAVLKCEGCAMSKFGYPNDEGLPEHPLYNHGIANCSSPVMEVLNSAWARELSSIREASRDRIWGSRRIAVALPTRKELRHFVIALKEATFECLAENLRVLCFYPTFQEAYAHVKRALASH
jgi:hypothetical protein